MGDYFPSDGAFMRFLTRTGTFALQLTVFFVLLALLSYLATYLTAERYAPGNIPSPLFPVVAVQPAATPRYELLRWPQLVRKDPPPLSWNLRLPEPKGGFAAPATGGFEPYVHFSAEATADGGQRVEVKVTEDGYVLYAAYATDGAKVVPESFRLWGPSSALFVLFPVFVLTVVLSRVVTRRYRQQAQQAKPGSPD
jgi:hypothetical protein